MIGLCPTETSAKTASSREYISLTENQVQYNRGPQLHSVPSNKNNNWIKAEDHNQLLPSPDSIIPIGVEMFRLERNY